MKGIRRWRRPLAGALVVCTVGVALAGLPVAGPWFVVPAAATTGLAVLLLGWPLGGPALSPPLVLLVSSASLAVSVLHPGPYRGNVGTPWIVLETAALSVLVAHVVRRASPWPAAVTALMVEAAGAGLPLRIALVATQYFTFQDDVGVSLFWAIWPAVGAAAGLYLRHLDRRRDVLVRNARREQRRALARDLHDFVAHDVGGVVLEAQAAQVARTGYPEAALAAFRRIEEAGLKALAATDRSVRLLSGEGAPAETDGSLRVHDLSDLPDVIDRFSPTSPAQVRLHMDAGVPGMVAAEISATAYRVVVEALTNVRRHARGVTRVDVTVGLTDGGRLCVSVVDDGSGGGRRGGRGGLGIVGLRERVQLLEGTLTAGPTPGGGWRLEADLPR